MGNEGKLPLSLKQIYGVSSIANEQEVAVLDEELDIRLRRGGLRFLIKVSVRVAAFANHQECYY